MVGAGESILAVTLSLMGGLFNASWPLFCKPDSPRVMRIATSGGWQWENVWLPFTLWSTALNALLCVWVVGLRALSAVYREVSPRDLGLVCTFSFLWGSGSACFSLGIQLLGAGLGTAVVMSLLVVIGTLLPLIEDHADDAGSPAALVTVVGLLFAISGFVLSAQSSRMKAHAAETVNTPTATVPDDGVPAPVADESAVEVVDVDDAPGTHSKTHKDCVQPAGQTKYLTAVAVCVTGAVMSSMLQFAFVYGDPLITHAEENEGLSDAAAPLVVWLLAFSLAAVWNVVYAVYLLSKNKTWARYVWTGWADLTRKFWRITVMSVFFVGHVHFYGQSQQMFGDLGPVVAWPLTMSSAVLSGQIWSIFMREWVGVPRLALKVNIASACLLVAAVAVIAVAGAVL